MKLKLVFIVLQAIILTNPGRTKANEASGRMQGSEVSGNISVKDAPGLLQAAETAGPQHAAETAGSQHATEPRGPAQTLETPGEKAYLFAYFTDKNSNRNGLHFAWSRDGYRWTAIGPEHSFLRSDYGSWGTEKRMRDPFIMQGPDGLWHCLWTLNWEANAIGHAASSDLIHWSRQRYPKVMAGYEVRNCWAPEMVYDEEKQQYVIFWASTIRVNGEWKTEAGHPYDNRMYYTTTKDFKSYTPAKIFFDPGHNVIDATVRRIGDQYYMIYKNEQEVPVPQKNLLVAVSSHAEGPYRTISEKPFTRDWVEGPAICRLPDSSFLVYMDAYLDHRYEAKRTRDFVQWEDMNDRISIPGGLKHGSIIEVPMAMVDKLIGEQQRAAQKEREANGKEGVAAPKPVFRDPVYDGAADPVVIWNPMAGKWWMYYTNRRANQTKLPGVSWVFGTPVGIAESADGANWSYVGTAQFSGLTADCGGKDATFWAPDVILGDDGKWHMYLSIQPGIDVKWGLPGFIAHLTSTDMLNWKFESRLSQLGTHVIDADILKMPDGSWRMYYKGSHPHSNISMTESKDLFNWSAPKEVIKISGEGPAVFRWKDRYWMLVDTWNGQTVFGSEDGNKWEKQAGSPLLPDGEGTGPDDIPNALHANVVVSDRRAYLYYFTHPGRVGEGKKKDGYEQRRTSVQVVELELSREGRITADRNQTTYVNLLPASAVSATLTIGAGKAKSISSELFGVFFEDINYAADGGLYAEMVQNRSFEYDPADVAGRDSTWNSRKSWELMKTDEATGGMEVRVDSPLHPNNPHYAVLTLENTGGTVGLANSGYDGMVIKAGDAYNFSAFARLLAGKGDRLTVSLVGTDGVLYAEAQTGKINKGWERHAATLVPSANADDARLVVTLRRKGQVALDMISLFPEKTFKNRPNGLRADLAQSIAGLKPRFVRFPGGCLVHGDGLGNMYRWKNTVGPVEQRTGQRNIWNYQQSAGLGYFEYFQFCEDIGAIPVPVVPAGVSCQNSREEGQQGIPLSEMDAYVQEILDLVEYANGPAGSKWGKVRTDAGHPEPFNLKYIGIGNEDQISDRFEERFRMIYDRLRKEHPEITIIGTAGPFCEGTDYEEGWKIARELDVPVVDEHYYQPPGWFIHNQDFYDHYPRGGSKVYLGEYASRGNTLYNALAEAAYMTALERNGDVVCMASYAPLLAREGHTQWNPDLIYFNGKEVKPTVNYQVQKLFGLNAGEQYLEGELEISQARDAVRKRLACSVVKSGDELIVKLVNLLPVKANVRILTEGISGATGGTRTVLTGMPGDRYLTPQVFPFGDNDNFHADLPPYSLTVIRTKIARLSAGKE